MTAAALALLLLITGDVIPDWAIQLDATPREGPHLIPDGSGGQCILIPLGNAGLGGFSSTGVAMAGFPLSRGSGVIWRPAWVPGPSGESFVAYGDNDGLAHLCDLQGNEAPGWPVSTGSSIVTGVSAVDLDCDGMLEITFGTSNGKVWLLDTRGEPIPGWPVNLSSQLLWQPTQVSLGGGAGKGLICALNNASITVLDHRGAPLPGWPVNLPFPVGTNPVSGDVNGDGQADIIFACQNKRFNLFSTQGRQQDGWPFYLDDRPVRGAPALGVVTPGGTSPQVAVATIDSLVYLINGDGSLEGTWRWPNKTTSAPFQPIIVGTRSGPAVLTASENGEISAWDATGREITGFPFQHPGGIAFQPVAGDLDGNGTGELIVLGRGGHLAVYSLNAANSELGFWNLPMADPSNSGIYGCMYLPVATVGDIENRTGGDVAIPYSISGSSTTGVSLYYSLDAGYSWQETRSFSEQTGMIIWHTNADLPHSIEDQVVVRVTPYFRGGPGECGISRIFKVDNNIPPTIFLHAPEDLGEGRFSFTYAVDDPEGDIIQIQAQFSTDGGQNWQMMHLTGTTLEIEPWFYGEPFQWSAVRDLGRVSLENLHIRVRAADAKPGEWHSMEGLSVATERMPSAQIIAPVEKVSGQVRLGVRLSDPETNVLDVKYEYSIDGGDSWFPATVIEAEGAGTVEFRFDILWESETDLPGFSGNRVRMRALPLSSMEGIAVPSAPFHLDNNHQPEITILSPTGYDLFRGMVPVSFQLSDPEGDEIRLGIQYRLTERTGWLNGSGVMNSGPFSPSNYNSVLYWNSSADLPLSDVSDVEIRLVAFNGDTTFSAVSGPIALGNANLPEVVRTTVASLNEQTGRAVIAYEIVDQAERIIDLEVHYSTDGGERWRAATVSGALTGIREISYSGTFEWHWRNDTMDNHGTVILRLTPRFVGGNAGRPRFMEQVFR